MTALDALFAPHRVAILGASRNPAKLGHVLLRNVLEGGFTGEVFVVNPSGEPILGRPTVAGAAELPQGIDLVLVSLPPPAVLGAIRDLAARGARAAVILTSGFGEVDERGRREQSAILEAARAGGLRLVGPNCMGVFSGPAALNGTYFWDLPRLPGGIGVVSQSGAYGGLIMRHLGALGLGVCRFLSIGNQADVTIAEALEYLAEDRETALVACFIEYVGAGRRFVQAARRVTASKPMVVLKAGRTDAGRRAAGSHTGALAGTAEVYQAAFRRAGIVQCVETEEFFDTIQALTTARVRPSRPSLVIVTVSGGPSVAAADAAEASGIAVPALDDEVQRELRPLLPRFAAVGNPVDLTPQVEPQNILEIARLICMKSKTVGILAMNVGLDIPEFADGIIEAARSAGKPLVACSVDAPRVMARLKSAGAPVYPTPERAVRAYRALWLAGQRPSEVEPGETPRGRLGPGLAALLASAHGALSYPDARELLAAYGLGFCRERTVVTLDGAVEAASALGYPVVVKSARADVLHKSEEGAVVTGVSGPGQLRAACRAIARRVGPGGWLVQEQVPRGVELLVGGRRDESFGPVVVVGLGGFLAEAIRDISLALAPLSLEEAQALVVQGLRGGLVRGYRGLPAWNPARAAHALVAVGRLLDDHPRIREVDVNPVIVAGETALAVDALVLLD